MKKALLFFFALASLVFASGAERATASPAVNAYLFYGDGCPHCAVEKSFLDEMKREFLNEEKSPVKRFALYEFEIYHSRENALLMQKAAQALGVDAGGVPFLIIGDKHFIGFARGITDEQIASRINECLQNGCPDSIAAIVGVSAPEPAALAPDSEPPQENKTNEIGETKEKMISLPFLGEIDALSFSLPVLAIVMGALDGFNPCAMWVLLFLISLLLGIEDRKRMWILGSAFIIAPASVYFLFMAAWLNLILLLGFVIWVRFAIGILALGGGIYSLREFFTNKANVCKVTDGDKQQRVFEKLRLAVSQKSFLLALGGIIALAFMVNLVELVCSAGLPAVYTQVLALNDLSAWQYYLYIFLYIFFFMLDDLLVFFIAMMTLQMTGITSKYARYSRLIGGAIMLAIGLALLFKPELLMFG